MNKIICKKEELVQLRKNWYLNTALNLEEITHLEAAVDRLRKKMIVEEEMIGDDSKVKYFIGLPSYGILKTVFDFIYSLY